MRSARRKTLPCAAVRRRSLRPVLVLLALVLPSPAGAQSGRQPGLSDLVHAWASGRFSSPVVCQVEGEPRRALRRIVIQPLGADATQPGVRLLFPDPEAPGATRCFSELGPDEPRVEGSLVLAHEGRARPDTAQYDFQSALRRDGGFDLVIRSGRLQVRGWDGAAARDVEFAKGAAHVRSVKPGSDEGRILASYPAARALVLELEAPDGTRLVFPMVQLIER